MSKLYNIKNWTRHNLRAWMAEKSIKHSKVQEFRADQIFYWLYQKKAESFSEMHNIGLETRKIMEENFWISSLEKAETQQSQDCSIK